MKIKVLKTTKAASCPKGIESKEYTVGQTYQIFDELAQVFISQGWGKEAKEEKKEVVIVEEKKEEKSFAIKLENKAIEKVEEDKVLEVEKKSTKKKSTKKKGKK